MRREHEPRPAWVARSTPLEPREQAPGEALRRRQPAARSKRRSPPPSPHAPVDVARAAPSPAVGPLEERERPVEPPAVGVRVQIAQAGRHAAPHLPVDGGMSAAGQARPQWRSPNSDSSWSTSSARRGLAAHGPMFTAWPRGRLPRHLEHRVGDVEPAAQVAVAVRVLHALVAGRLPGLDQPVLQHAARPARSSWACSPTPRRAPSSPPARRSARGRALRTETDLPTYSGRPRWSRKRRRPGRRAASRGPAARSGGRASPAGFAAPAAAAGERPARRHVGRVRAHRGNSAQNTRAHVSASGSARWAPSTSIPSDSASGASPRWRCSGAKRAARRDGAQHGGDRPVHARALEAPAQHAPVEAGVVRDQHAAAQPARPARPAPPPAAARRPPWPA